QAEYEELLLAHDRAVLDAVPAETLVVVHLCGSRLNFDLAAEFRADGISWATTEPGNPSLAEGRERSGRAGVGGVPETAALVAGSAGEVRRAVRAAVDETDGRRVVIAPGCSVPPTASSANMRAMVEEAAAERAA